MRRRVGRDRVPLAKRAVKERTGKARRKDGPILEERKPEKPASISGESAICAVSFPAARC